MSLPVEFHPRAINEARGAREVYLTTSGNTADRFMAELDEAVSAVGDTPELFSPHIHGTRFIRLKHFPYRLIYRILDTAIQVVAVAHERRKPGYWRRRVSASR